MLEIEHVEKHAAKERRGPEDDIADDRVAFNPHGDPSACRLAKRCPISENMNLELSDEQAAALARELTAIIDDDRYPLSPRIQSLREIRNMIRPEPKREPLPEPKRYEPPRGGRYRRRESGPSRFGAAWFRRDSASAPRMTQFSADGSVELVLW